MASESINELAKILRESQTGAQIARENSNFAKPTYGKIVDTKDPENRGRVKVIIDEVNPEIHNERGFKDEGQATVSDWMEPKVPFKGTQPEALVGKRVPMEPKQGDPNRMFFGAPVNDPGETGDAAAPENSDATRLQVFPSGSLPPADAENIGLMVVEQGGPMESDWLCVCLKRKGSYFWVRHIDLDHGHAGQDDSDPKATKEVEPPDDKGHVKQFTVWDFVFPTTDKEYPKKPVETIFGTDPRFRGTSIDGVKHQGGA